MNAGVASKDELQNALSKLRSMDELQNLPISKLNNIDFSKYTYTYPNGRVVDDIKKAAKEIGNIQNTPYNNVFYDPASWVEFNWRNSLP